MISVKLVVQLGLILAVIALTFFVLILPQLWRIKRHEEFLKQLKIGDVVVSGGGLIGKVVGWENPRVVEIELADQIIVKVIRNSLEVMFAA